MDVFMAGVKTKSMSDTIFIGRQNELEQLSEHFESVKKNLGKFILVKGEPGSGKTSFVREFLTHHLNNEVHTLATECKDIQGVKEFSPIEDINKQIITLFDKDFFKESNKNPFKRLQKIMDDDVQDILFDLMDFVPLVGPLAKVGAKVGKNLYGRFFSKSEDKKTGQEIHSEKIYKAFEKALLKLAERKPVVVFFDDLQWADASSLDLLLSFARFLKTASVENPLPIMVIGTYRTKEILEGRMVVNDQGQTVKIQHPLARIKKELYNYTKTESHISRKDNWFAEIAITSLAEDNIMQLIAKKYPENNFPNSFASQLTDLTKGHALFVTVILKTLEERDDIHLDESRQQYQLKANVLEDIPASISQIMEDQIERLDDELREIIECSSVYGVDFNSEIVADILETSKLKVIKRIDTLVKKHGLLVESDKSDSRPLQSDYSFLHMLGHKYVYDHLGKPLRKEYHKEIARIIKEKYSHLFEENPALRETYQKHLDISNGILDGSSLNLSNGEGAKDIEQQDVINSARSKLEFGFSSLKNDKAEEALSYANAAQALIAPLEMNSERQEMEISVLELRCSINEYQGDLKKSIKNGKKLFDMTADTSRHKSKYIAAHTVGEAYFTQLDLPECVFWYQRAYQAATQLQETNYLLLSIQRILSILQLQSRYAETFNYLEEARTLVEKSDDEDLVFEMNLTIADNYKNVGDYEAAFPYYEKALKLGSQTKDALKEARANDSIASVLHLKEDFAAAIAYSRKAIAITENLQMDDWRASCMVQYAKILTGLERFDEAIKYYHHASAVFKENGYPDYLSENNNQLGITYRAMGEFDTAIAHFDKELTYASERQEDSGIAMAMHNIALCYHYIGESDKAIDYFEQCLEIDKKLKDTISIAYDYRRIGLPWQTKGFYEKAITFYEMALEIDEGINDHPKIFEDHMQIASAYLDMENYPKALKHYDEAEQHIDPSKTFSKYASLLFAKAKVFVIQNNNKEAYQLLKQAHEYYQKADVTSGRIYSLVYRAFLEGREKDLREAAHYLLAARDVDKAHFADFFKNRIALFESVQFRKQTFQNLFALAKTLYENKFQEESLIALDMAYNLALNLRDFNLATDTAFSKANLLIEKGTPEEALELFYQLQQVLPGDTHEALIKKIEEQAAKIREQLKETNSDYITQKQQQINELFNSAQVANQNRQYEVALNEYRKIINIARHAGEMESLAKSYELAADASNMLDDNKQTIDFYEQAAKMYEAMKNTLLAGKVRKEMAFIQRSTSQFSEAIQSMKQALNLFSQEQNEREVCECQNYIGLFYDNLEELDHALEHYEKALELAEKNNYSDLIPVLYNNIAMIYLTKNDHRAVTFMEKVINLTDPAKNDNASKYVSQNQDKNIADLAMYYQNLAYAYQQTENDEAAHNAYESSLELYMEAAGIMKNNYERGVKLSKALELADLLDNQKAYIQALLMRSQTNKEYEPEEALKDCERGIEMLRNLDMPAYQSAFYKVKADLLEQNQAYEEALQYAIKAHEIDKQTNQEHKTVILGYYEIGRLLYLADKTDEALEYLGKGLSLAELEEDPAAIYLFNNFTGRIFSASDMAEPAEKYLARAFDVAKEQKDLLKMLSTISDLSKLYQNQRRKQESLSAAKEMIRLSIMLNNNDQIAESYYELARHYSLFDEPDKSIEAFGKAMEFGKKTDNQHNLAIYLNDLAVETKKSGNLSKAIEWLEQAASLDVDNPYLTALVHSNLGHYFSEMGAYDQSCYHHQVVVDTYLPTENEKEIADAYNNLGICCIHSKKYDEAAYNLNNALDWSERANYFEGQLESLTQLGILAENEYNYQKAFEQYSAALQIAETMKNQYQKARLIYYIGMLQYYSNQFPKALEILRQSQQIIEKNELQEYLPEVEEMIKEIQSLIGSDY